METPEGRLRAEAKERQGRPAADVPDAGGRVNAVFQTPSDIPPRVAMAVTIEPEGGVPAPTGARYLIGALAL